MNKTLFLAYEDNSEISAFVHAYEIDGKIFIISCNYPFMDSNKDIRPIPEITKQYEFDQLDEDFFETFESFLVFSDYKLIKKACDKDLIEQVKYDDEVFHNDVKFRIKYLGENGCFKHYIHTMIPKFYD